MAAHGVFYEKLIHKKNSYYILFIVCVGLVAINILASQSYPPLMYEVMQGEPAGVTQYLRRIWGTPLFVEEMNIIKRTNNTSVLQNIQTEDDRQNATIQSLLTLTQTYPYAPELYYNLSLIFEKRGDNTKARYFLKKAQQIDPSYR